MKIINATINLTTLATRLLGKPIWQFQAIQETRKHARKNLWRAGIGVAFLHAVYTMYKRWNYVEKVPPRATFRHVRRALQA